MNKFENEDVNLSILPEKSFRIILRSVAQKNIYFNFEKHNELSLNEFKENVKIFFKKIKNFLKLEKEANIRLIYKGKLIENNQLLSELSILNINLDFNKDDVILYMVQEKSIFSKNKEFLKTFKENNWENRGFDKLKESGLEDSEIDQLRESFHQISFEIEKMGNISDLINKLIFREENWLNYVKSSKSNKDEMDSPKKNNLLFNIQDLPTISTKESNLVYFYSFFLGLFLNVYSEIIVKFGLIKFQFYELKPKFKIGLRVGMTIGIILFLIFFIITAKN